MRFTTKNTLALLATITLAINASPCLDDIPNASYAIFEGGKEPDVNCGLFGVPNKNVTFYTFDGTPIITLNLPLAYHFGYPKVSPGLRLDPNAPKPQPVTYEIKPVSKMHGLFGSGKSIILFYDKHDNVIAEFECCKKNYMISITFYNPDIDSGCIGSITTLSAPSFEILKELIMAFKSFPIDLSRVTEKPTVSKK